MEIAIEKIPKCLKQLPQWVLWKMASDRKMPFQDDGEQAKAGDPLTWNTFENILAAYQAGGYLGVGFEFHDDEFAGVDLDGCRNPQTGITEPWGREVIAKFDSYTELSPSKTGFKLRLLEHRLLDLRRTPSREIATATR
jgi:putative DNA primase/helicase